VKVEAKAEEPGTEAKAEEEDKETGKDKKSKKGKKKETDKTKPAEEEKRVQDPRMPVDLVYCGLCTRPLEYCIFSEDPAGCQAWAFKNASAVYKEIYGDAVPPPVSVPAPSTASASASASAPGSGSGSTAATGEAGAPGGEPEEKKGAEKFDG
jgi:hypothetical protein